VALGPRPSQWDSPEVIRLALAGLVIAVVDALGLASGASGARTALHGAE
jgi:hypothetical protein